MLSAALKNGILVLLIVLIIHMLLTNVMLERFPAAAPLAVAGAEKLPYAVQGHADPIDDAGPAGEKKDRHLELFRWAFDDGREEFDDGKCLPKPNVCDSHLDVDAYFKDNAEQPLPPGKQDGETLIIASYANEKDMNGGTIPTAEGSYHAYDAGDELWAEVGAPAPAIIPPPLKPCGTGTVRVPEAVSVATSDAIRNRVTSNLNYMTRM